MTVSYTVDMANRTSKPVTITLGDLADDALARVATGRYASMSEMVRAGLRALDREEAALDALILARIAEVNAGPADRVLLADGMALLRARLTRPA